ncbi:MAG: sigma-70 family RNA polymerase sigma factor [Bacteroidales bacterium]|nr:sigma-70 family RNA polymerase sigma factor [Bacteroidales bacterium]
MDLQATYTALLCRHRQLVWTLCWARARGDRERCRDLVQDVSLSLWEHFGKLRPEASPFEERAWVAWHTRTVLDHLHRRPSPTLVPLPDNLSASEDHDRETLDELLESLTDTDRQLVQLRLEGYNADEIAEQTGLRRDAVYQRLHRIIERLRKEKR